MGTCWELTARTRGGHGGDTWDYLGRGCNKDELGYGGDMSRMGWGCVGDTLGTWQR